MICALLLWVNVYEAHSADICSAVAVRDVPAIEDSSSILKKGEIDDAITQYLVNKRTGRTFFCSHGGYCYPTRVEVRGDLLEALRLTNCRVADKPGYSDAENITYDVEPIRSRAVQRSIQLTEEVESATQHLG
jgi:hypothetical protein